MLTNEQIALLKTHALTNPSLVTAINTGDDAAIQAYFNAIGSLYAWKTNVPPDDYLGGIDWTEVDGLTNGRARIWEWVTSGQTRPLNFALPNIRAGLNETFTNAQQPNSRSGLLGLASRLMTKAEELLVVSNSATGTQFDAKTMTYEGFISLAEASLIRVYGD